jgi:hypothetical protein
MLARAPDPVVFGTWPPARDFGGPMTLRCPECDVKWAWAAGPACWICGRLA